MTQAHARGGRGGGSARGCSSSIRSRRSPARCRRCSAFVAGSGSGQGGRWALPRSRSRSALAVLRWFTTRYRITRAVQVGSGCSAAAAGRLPRPGPDGRRHRAPAAPRARARARHGRHRALGPRADGRRRAARRPRRARGAPACATSCCTAAAGAAPAADDTAGGARGRRGRDRARPPAPGLAPLRAVHALGPGLRSASSPASSLNVAYEPHLDPRARPAARCGRRARPRAGRPRRRGSGCSPSSARGGGLDGRLRARVLGFSPHAPSGGTIHVTRGLHHHPRDDDRGAPPARRRDRRAAAAALGRRRALHRDRHRAARRPRGRAGRIAAVPPGPRAGCAAWPPRCSARSDPVTAPLAAHGPRARGGATRARSPDGRSSSSALAIGDRRSGAGAPGAGRRSCCCPSPSRSPPTAPGASATRSPDRARRARGSLVRRRGDAVARGHHRLNAATVVLPAPRGPGHADARRRPPAPGLRVQDVDSRGAARVRAAVPGLAGPFLDRPPTDGQAAARAASSAAGGSPASSPHSRVR